MIKSGFLLRNKYIADCLIEKDKAFVVGAFEVVVRLFFMWAVTTPPSAGCPGWCYHQPVTILNAPFFVRRLLFRKVLLIITILLFISHSGLKAQNDLNVIKNWIQFSDAPNSLYHYLADQAYELLDKREQDIARLHTLSEWQNRQKWIREKLNLVFGAFPPKTPLNARITKTIIKDRLKVEHIVFESQPGFFVTSSLFIPSSLKKGNKAPAIIYCSGHTNQGYRHPVYQQAILNLVDKGFIVFAFDPLDQGERWEYYDPKTNTSIIGERDEEHSYMGAQLFLSGSSLAKYMLWDGIRALDYLVTRKEVDIARIGITGRSGGGTQSAYIAAMDDRIFAAAPGNYITNFKRLIASSGPQCAEQDPFQIIKQGLDIPDFLIVRAPKPTLVMATTRDQIFSIQGAMEAVEETNKIYQAYNKIDHLGFSTDDTTHASTRRNRESVYAFFQKFLQNPGDSMEHKVPLLSEEELRVTRTGQVATTYDAESVYSLNKKTSEKAPSLSESSKTSASNDNFQRIKEKAKELSGYRQPEGSYSPDFMGRFNRDGYTVEKYLMKGEGNYVIPYLLMKPDHSNNKAVIYLHPKGKSIDASPGGKMEWLARKGFTVLAPDMIGTGEMGPGVFRGDSYIQGVSYNIWFLSMLIGRSIAGIQAADIVRLSHHLADTKGIDSVYAIAIDEMSPVLVHAAAFDSSISRIALLSSYLSYLSIINNRFYKPAYVHGAVPGALSFYDLSDLASHFSPANLIVTDSYGREEEWNDIFKSWLENAYLAKK